MTGYPFKISLIAFSLVGTLSASAAEGDKPAKAEERLAALMEKYESTGETRSCITIRQVRESNVIDDQTIFFEIDSKTGYLNHLPRTCPRLGSERRFAYKVTTGQLCNVDIITVLDNDGRAWSSCGLGHFEVLTKKAPADGE